MLILLITFLLSIQSTFGEPSLNSEKSWNEIAISRIAPLPADATLTFMFCSDLHIPFDNKGVVNLIVKKANELGPSFVISGGDNVQVGSAVNYNFLKKIINKFKIPFIAAIGNHDTDIEGYEYQTEWKKRFGKTFFYFDSGPARFIFLNNANFELEEEQFSFLENSLKTDLQKFIIMHRPPNYLNPLYTTPMDKSSQKFKKLIEEAKVTAVLMGHEHHFGIYEINGTKYIVSGGGGGMLNTTTENNYHHLILGQVSPLKFAFEVIKL